MIVNYAQRSSQGIALEVITGNGILILRKG